MGPSAVRRQYPANELLRTPRDDPGVQWRSESIRARGWRGGRHRRPRVTVASSQKIRLRGRADGHPLAAWYRRHRKPARHRSARRCPAARPAGDVSAGGTKAGARRDELAVPGWSMLAKRVCWRRRTQQIHSRPLAARDQPAQLVRQLPVRRQRPQPTHPATWCTHRPPKSRLSGPTSEGRRHDPNRGTGTPCPAELAWVR